MQLKLSPPDTHKEEKIAMYKPFRVIFKGSGSEIKRTPKNPKIKTRKKIF